MGRRAILENPEYFRISLGIVHLVNDHREPTILELWSLLREWAKRDQHGPEYADPSSLSHKIAKTSTETLPLFTNTKRGTKANLDIDWEGWATLYWKFCISGQNSRPLNTDRSLIDMKSPSEVEEARAALGEFVKAFFLRNKARMERDVEQLREDNLREGFEQHAFVDEMLISIEEFFQRLQKAFAYTHLLKEFIPWRQSFAGKEEHLAQEAQDAFRATMKGIDFLTFLEYR